MEAVTMVLLHLLSLPSFSLFPLPSVITVVRRGGGLAVPWQVKGLGVG